MEKAGIFILEVNLQRFSLVAAAIHFWEMPYLKKERSKFYKKYVNQCSFHELYIKWLQITEVALSYVKSLHLNLKKEMASQLEATMIYIGDKIFDWVSYIVKCHQFDLKYAETIYWTSHGTIDDAKILRMVWQNDRKFPWADNQECASLRKITFYNMCFMYATIDIIESNKREIVSTLKELFYGKEIRKKEYSVFEIMALIHCEINADDTTAIFTGQGKCSAELYKEVFNSTDMSPAATLFFSALGAHTDRAIEYFYGKLTKKERDQFLRKAAGSILFYTDEFDEKGIYHKKERLASSILFLINHMSDKEKQKYLRERGVDVCKIFLTIPPYDKLCLPILKFIWEDFTKNDYFFMKEEILKFTLKLLKDSKETYHPSKKQVQQEFFENLLKMTSKDSKKKLIVDEKFSSLSKLFKLHDFVTLKLILNDPDLAQYKNEILNLGMETFQELAEKGKFQFIDKFLNEIFLEKDERKKFKIKLKFTVNVLLNGQIDLAEKFLNWVSNSRKEKQKLKNLINPFEICSELICQRYFNLASEYLIWQLDYSVDDQNIVKLDLKSKILLSELCKIWCEEFDKGKRNAKEKCNQLIKFFINEETEIIEDDEGFIRIFFQNMPSLDCVRMADDLLRFCLKSTADDLLRFCLKSTDRIYETKQKLYDDIDSWIESFAITENNFLLANALVDWLFRGSKKNAVVKNFINSPKGAELCVKVFESTMENILAVYNTWVKRSGEINEIKNYIVAVYGENSKERFVLGARSLLDKVGNGFLVKSDHVKRFLKNKATVVNEVEKDLGNGLPPDCKMS